MLQTAAASTSQRTPPAVTGHLTPRYNSELSPVTHATLHRPLPLSEQSLGHHLMFSFCGIYLPLFTHKSRYTCHRKTKPNITVNCSFLHRTTSQSLCHWAAMKHRTPSPTFPLKCIGMHRQRTHKHTWFHTEEHTLCQFSNCYDTCILALRAGHSSSPTSAPLHSGLRQATYTCVPLSPSIITWYMYQSKGSDALRLGR